MHEKTGIDPVKRELVKNALIGICDTMLVMIVRTARSTNIKNTMDFSGALCDAEGRLVAQGLAVPAHLGAIMPALAGCLAHFGDDVHDGDILCSNDPYSGCSHLNDIFMFKPVFADGRRIAFLCLILHHTDLGGRVPGGNAADSSEIFQEGLIVPPSKICDRGRPNATLLRILEHNTRIPQRMMGDIHAQIAALAGAARELVKFALATGTQALRASMADLIDYTERLTRAKIAELPDGRVEFEDWNDDDGAGGAPVRFHVTLTKQGERFIVDFTGTSPQGRGALHTNYAFTASCTYAALRCVIDPEIPNNAGFYAPISVIAPEGTFVNVRYPAALGARGQGGYRIRSTVLGALALLIPDRVAACAGGSEFGIVFAGHNGRDSKPFVHLEFHNCTGQGGGPDRDGQDGGPYAIGNLANVPVELLEAENPVLVEAYAFLPDSAGAGKYRGSLGIVRQYRILAEEATVNLRSDRHLHGCWGLFGGKPGAKARSIVNPGTPQEALAPSKFVRVMRRGEVFRGEMAASGGYGDPYTRDPAAVLEDVRQGKVSIAHARAAYGVCVQAETLTVDAEATAVLRAAVAPAG
ncbi:MAG: hydantoinase B/oxoprolinase family protein [Burkholderiales bacterium]|nr:hydantoinase B/oxoprolinase family protein [Burkholderiales bacterium]